MPLETTPPRRQPLPKIPPVITPRPRLGVLTLTDPRRVVLTLTLTLTLTDTRGGELSDQEALLSQRGREIFRVCQ